MPNLFDEEDGDEGEGTSTDSGTTGAESGDANKDPKSDKRIRDLQSEKDKVTAERNQLRKQLDAITAAAKEPDAEGSKPPVSTGGDAVNDVVLEMARMFAFQQNPKLQEYEINASDLAGSTPGEIAQSATALVARFEKIETQARNKVLAAQGLAPEIEAGAGSSSAPRDFTNMPAEDFKKVMDEALNKAR